VFPGKPLIILKNTFAEPVLQDGHIDVVITLAMALILLFVVG